MTPDEKVELEERIEILELRVDNLTEQLEEFEDSIEQRVRDVVELFIEREVFDDPD